jgi:hypothetical protein
MAAFFALLTVENAQAQTLSGDPVDTGMAPRSLGRLAHRSDRLPDRQAPAAIATAASGALPRRAASSAAASRPAAVAVSEPESCGKKTRTKQNVKPAL